VEVRCIEGEGGEVKEVECARCQWLTPVIPTTWEAEIRRIVV
jgi:hypothetical protein